MSFPRSSGILLHPTSLPGRFGIGDLGDEAYAFADFLVASGQGLWQVLPLGPTGYGDSPYACYSAFAGNTLLVSPERLVSEGLLRNEDLADVPPFPDGRVNFHQVHQFKDDVLRQVFARFTKNSDAKLREAFQNFCVKNAAWLEDYALFRALKDTHGGKPWHEWEASFVRREPAALAQAREALRAEIEAQKFYQFLFFKQWFELKAYCNDRGIKLIGDI